MEQKTVLTTEFYNDLYEAIMDKRDDLCPEEERYNGFYIELEFESMGKRFFVTLDANYEVEYEDLSFDHAFGTHHDYTYNIEELDDIDNVYVCVIDENGDCVEEDIEFDTKWFWDQFKSYGTESKGVQIRYGDEVVVKYGLLRGEWKKMIYLYTDNRLGVHVCTDSLARRDFHGKFYTQKFSHILPATTGALSIIGKKQYGYHVFA